MGLKWFVGITLCLIAFAYSVPIEVIYGGDGCECPTKLAYQVNVPKPPKSREYTPYNYGYKVDVPPVPIKAKVSYTFDFTVEEPKPPRPEKYDKLNLYAKVDRIALNKPDCAQEYAPHPPSCGCNKCGEKKPIYRYVKRKLTPCQCRHPKCSCNLRERRLGINSQTTVGTPVLVASGRLQRTGNNIRRKRDLHRLFFRQRRQELRRLPRYVKMYHKSLSQQGDGWFNIDLFANPNAFKRKTKKVFFPYKRSKIVKRDIKGEYDLLEKERDEADLTLPEIIQFMPETLQPNFKRGQCHFGCVKPKIEDLHASEDNETTNDDQKNNDTKKSNESTIHTPLPSFSSNNHNSNDETFDKNNDNNIASPFTKRNAAGYNYENFKSSYEAAASAIPRANAASYAEQQNDYAADISQPLSAPNPTNPVYGAVEPAMLSPCEQRKVYASMRQAAETEPQYNAKQPENNGQLGYLVSTARVIPDPYNRYALPLHYAGDLEVPHYNYQENSELNPSVGATQYPVQHVSSELLDRIISDIVYRHPDFIEATSHYGGALVDPEPYQEKQTKDFIKKLLDGRFGMLFGETEEANTHYYPLSNSGSQIYNPYTQSRHFTYYPTNY